jgi:hypothetical protein
VVHELGHALGLGHSADLTSVMYATLAAGAANRNLTGADLKVPDADSGGPAGMHVRLPGRLMPAQSSVGTEDGRRIAAELPAALAAVDQVLEAWAPISGSASSVSRLRLRTMRPTYDF